MNVPAMMRALQQTSLNGPQDLRLISGASVPVAGPGQVLLRVTAAGVNYVDISQARGQFGGGPQPPYLAGIEGVGEVIAVGEDVTDLERGAHVVGVSIRGGAFAEYMVLPAAAAVPVPDGWADMQALGLVVNWPTALAALRPLGGVTAGQTVLIHAAAGGTGQAAVKLAKHYGATVIATASPGKHEVVRALGADHIIDSRGADIAAEVLQLTEGAGADLVLESVGGATLDASLAATKRVTGRVIVYGMAGGDAAITNWELVYKHQVHVIGLNIGVLVQAAPQIFGEVMGELFGLLAVGVLSPGRPTAYELAEGPKALTDVLNGVRWPRGNGQKWPHPSNGEPTIHPGPGRPLLAGCACARTTDGPPVEHLAEPKQLGGVGPGEPGGDTRNWKRAPRSASWLCCPDPTLPQVAIPPAT